ncbi:MAG TPA: polyribonucleotide nucleotidyltransferase, partial [Acidimicrobiaceae bacterium]|nr:polyribonucleotide nucleotidyltransferase [Acidimicrobiaceae bacterium]
DGRATDELRPLSAEVGYLATAHGSGLFQRGETQVLNVTTLGMTRMEQLIDTLNPDNRKRYMHHYNFPPFSTGEAGFMRGPKRREIGHGALAERALLPVVPSKEDFPYALRLVSDVLSSNGSTSMASVCASSMSLMDAGVPIRDHVSGIAMGLVHAEGRYVTLTDILGAEDAFGDMDFKIAGTHDAITALQLDTKIDGIPADVLAQALSQARVARLQILEVMRAAIAEPRPDVNENAPKILSFEIPVDKIAEVIGPRGKVINALQEETGTDISVDDDGTVGTVSIAATDREAIVEAKRQVQLIINPPTADLGATYEGRVVNITKFGAFVNLMPGTDGLLHISRIGGRRRLESVEEVLNLGDSVRVVVDDIDRNGKISLVMADDADGGAGDGDSDPASAVFGRTDSGGRDGGGRG